MNGFLSPNGAFYKCNYGQHSELAQELNKIYNFQIDPLDKFWRDEEGRLKKNGFIYLGYTGNLGTNTDSYVFTDFGEMRITKEQQEWFEDNRDELQPKQIDEFLNLIEFYGEK